MAALWPLGAGLLFACGLALSGMTHPAKVRGFLDVTGHWDPTLAFVMAGAVSVYFVAQRAARRRPAPWLGGAFPGALSSVIDKRLLGGAALFGVGWGVCGFCPGPALVDFGAGAAAAWWFVPAMLGGMLAYEWFSSRARQQTCGELEISSPD